MQGKLVRRVRCERFMAEVALEDRCGFAREGCERLVQRGALLTLRHALTEENSARVVEVITERARKAGKAARPGGLREV